MVRIAHPEQSVYVATGARLVRVRHSRTERYLVSRSPLAEGGTLFMVETEVARDERAKFVTPFNGKRGIMAFLEHFQSPTTEIRIDSMTSRPIRRHRGRKLQLEMA